MDPINPIVDNSEPLVNQNPEPQKMPSTNHSNSITVISMAVFVLMSLAVVGFLYYQNQQLKSMLANYQTPASSPTPAATADPTAGWKTYTNTEIGFSLKYPQEWILEKKTTPRIASFDTKSGTPGDFFVSYHKNISDLSKWLSDNQAGEIVGTIKMNDNQFSVIKGGALNASREYAIKVGTNDYLRIVIEPYPNKVISDEVINQILSTFKFTSPSASIIPSTLPVSITTPSATSKACTMEAKICPDGSAVGRSGPNCEFAACPTL